MRNVYSNGDKPLPRKGINVTVAGDVVAAARALKLNVSQAAESGIAAAVKQAREEAWLRENRNAIASHNARIEKYGTSLKPVWARD